MADQRQSVFLENYRARGQSFDSFLWEDWMFDYSRNIDIFAKLKGICLSSKEEENSGAETLDCYCIYGKDSLYKVVQKNVDDILLYVSDGSDFATFWTLEHTIDQSAFSIVSADFWEPKNAVVFDNKIYILCDKQVFEYDPATTTATKVTPTNWEDWDTEFIASFNYHETLLVVWKNDKLRTYDPNLWSSIWRDVVRDFSQGSIVWLLQYDDLIGVCVNHNGIDSRIYTLWGNFDVDDIWVLDTTKLDGISVVNTAQRGQDILLTAQDHWDSGRGELYNLVWKIPVSLKESRNGTDISNASSPNWVNETDFDFQVKRTNSAIDWLLTQPYPTKWNVVYLPMVDGLWIYWSPNLRIQDAVFNYHAYETFSNAPRTSCIFKDYLYIASTGHEARYYIGKNTSLKRYAEKWYVKGRTYWWDLMIMEKELLNIAVAYKLPDASCSIKVWIKTNKESRDVATIITDTTETFTVIKPTGVNNVSDILWDWNYIDYALELITTDDQYTPEVLEHGMFYDYVRNQL